MNRRPRWFNLLLAFSLLSSTVVIVGLLAEPPRSAPVETAAGEKYVLPPYADPPCANPPGPPIRNARAVAVQPPESPVVRTESLAKRSAPEPTTAEWVASLLLRLSFAVSNGLLKL